MNARRLETIFAEFGLPAEVVEVRTGPVVETYLCEPGPGVRVGRIAALEDDIALRLGFDTVRVVPNVPGVAAFGVEVPREDRQMVPFGPVPTTGKALPLYLGVDTLGQRVTVDLAKAPHVLVAGQTGSGKSICVHTMIVSLLLGRTPIRFVLIDPKRLEFAAYRGMSELLLPPIVDARDATQALETLVGAMEARYKVLERAGARDIAEYRARGGQMAYVVAVVDEWADLYVTEGKRIELPVVRLAQKARAAGIHLVLATQRPSVKVLPGIIKANFPARVALRVTNMTDSRVVLDQNGAERLLGRGDMLVSGFDLERLTRVHGSFVDPEDVFMQNHYDKRRSS